MHSTLDQEQGGHFMHYTLLHSPPLLTGSTFTSSLEGITTCTLQGANNMTSRFMTEMASLFQQTCTTSTSDSRTHQGRLQRRGILPMDVSMLLASFHECATHHHDTLCQIRHTSSPPLSRASLTISLSSSCTSRTNGLEVALEQSEADDP